MYNVKIFSRLSVLLVWYLSEPVRNPVSCRKTHLDPHRMSKCRVPVSNVGEIKEWPVTNFGTVGLGILQSRSSCESLGRVGKMNFLLLWLQSFILLLKIFNISIDENFESKYCSYCFSNMLTFIIVSTRESVLIIFQISQLWLTLHDVNLNTKFWVLNLSLFPES